MISQTSFHRGRDAQRLVRAAEVVERDIKRNSGLEIVQLFAESI